MKSNNRRMKKCFKLFIILFICLISSGCLTIIHYSPSVVESGKIHLGYGTRAAVLSSGASIDNSLFFRYGLPYEFDAGIECKTVFFAFPTYITLSLRKQFSFNSDYIDAMTIGVGGGSIIFKLFSGRVDVLDDPFAEMSFIKHPFAIRFGVGQTKINVNFPDSDVHRYNALLVQAIYEKQWKRFVLMPYINYEYVNDIDVEESTSAQSKDHLIGLGLSFYFELL